MCYQQSLYAYSYILNNNTLVYWLTYFGACPFSGGKNNGMSQKQHTTITRGTTPNILATSPPRRICDVADNVATTFLNAASAGFDSNAKVFVAKCWGARHSKVLTCYENVLLLFVCLLFVGCV